MSFPQAVDRTQRIMLMANALSNATAARQIPARSIFSITAAGRSKAELSATGGSTSTPVSFLSFPMFVPSLSWQNVRFNV